jgi:hypothetical protein
MSDTADVVHKAALKLYKPGVHIPAIVNQAMDQCEVPESEKPSVKTEVCSRFGTDGAKEKARLKRIEKQPTGFFRPRFPIQPVRTPEQQREFDKQNAPST